MYPACLVFPSSVRVMVAVTCQPADMLSAVMSVKCFHAILGEDSVSCGCEITHTFKNTPLLTGIFIALMSWGFAGVSGPKVMLSPASSQPCCSSLFCWKSLPDECQMEEPLGTGTLFQPLEMILLLESLSGAGGPGWPLLFHVLFEH